MRVPPLLSLAVVTVAALHPNRANGDAAITCRRAALELAGAWTNDGYLLRERTWAGTLPADKPALARVNLIAGNRYWFSAATNAASTTIAVHVFSDAGTPVETETYQEGPLAAAGFSPSESGTYIVGVSEAHGTPVPFCLIYSYK